MKISPLTIYKIKESARFWTITALVFGLVHVGWSIISHFAGVPRGY